MEKALKKSRPTKQRETDTSKDSKTGTASNSNSSSLDKTVIAIPLLDSFASAKEDDDFNIIIDLNLLYPDGLDNAKKSAEQLIQSVLAGEKKPISRGADKVARFGGDELPRTVQIVVHAREQI
ncbi:MAG: hypothetical protein ED859_06570 [Desulfuromonadales bacterium]|nr:MAG: hypothetical protein ED859_06570 [Desulfuromonadales bacterium]